MARILFYTSIQTRVRDQESLMIEFIRQGHQVFFLNQQPNSYLPTICKQAGVSYFTIPKPTTENSLWKSFYYFKQLVWFSWRNNIKIIYSHLEPANFIAVFVQFFVLAKVIIVRHHHDLAELAGFSRDRSYRLTYQLARNIISVSESTKRYMIEKEGVTEGKIKHIALGYDFSLFGDVSSEMVTRLRHEVNDKVSLITVGRLDKFKRPEVSINLVKKLNELGVRSHLRLLGSGDLRGDLEQLIKRNNLIDQVEFIEYSDNVLTYLKASDWLIHPSISESSCVVVKEAGIVELPVIVCKGVGDFDEYLVHGLNSFLVSPEKFVEESAEIVKYYYASADSGRENLGRLLNSEIKNRFHISSVIEKYQTFQQD